VAKDSTSRRIHPRLRYIRNGAAPVNMMRSAISSTVASSATPAAASLKASAGVDLGQIRDSAPIGTAQAAPLPKGRIAKQRKLASQPAATESFVNVFIELYRDRPAPTGRRRTAAERIRALAEAGRGKVDRREKRGFGSDVMIRRNFISATLPISALRKLEQDPDVAFVHPSEPLRLDQPTLQPQLTAPPAARQVGDPALRARHGDGKDVIIGIIDVGGFDFAHDDFSDGKGGTRFLSIWDQGGTFRPPPSRRSGGRFDYGSELTKPLMDAAIAAASAGTFPATHRARTSPPCLSRCRG